MTITNPERLFYEKISEDLQERMFKIVTDLLNNSVGSYDQEHLDNQQMILRELEDKLKFYKNKLENKND